MSSGWKSIAFGAGCVALLTSCLTSTQATRLQSDLDEVKKQLFQVQQDTAASRSKLEEVDRAVRSHECDEDLHDARFENVPAAVRGDDLAQAWRDSEAAEPERLLASKVDRAPRRRTERTFEGLDLSVQTSAPTPAAA